MRFTAACLITMELFKPGLLSLICVLQSNLATLGRRAGSMKFSIHNEERINIRKIICIILTVLFFYILCNKNILSLIGKIYEKYSYIIGEVVAILAHFDKVINDVSQ